MSWFRRDASYLPRFSEENFGKNLALVKRFEVAARKKGCTVGQLALARLMKQGEDVSPIPGTKRVGYLEGNVGAVDGVVSNEEEKEIRGWIEMTGVPGILGS